MKCIARPGTHGDVDDQDIGNLAEGVMDSQLFPVPAYGTVQVTGVPLAGSCTRWYALEADVMTSS